MSIRIIISIILISVLLSIALNNSCGNDTVTNSQNSPNMTAQNNNISDTLNQTSLPEENASYEKIPDSGELNEELTDSNSTNIIIDHSNWDWYNIQPQNVIDNVAKLRVFFAHASIGNNIIDGMEALHASDSAKYPLIAIQDDSKPPDVTIDGYLYEYYRGNPDWTEKLNTYSTYTINGWRYPTVNISMNKLCAIDEETAWETYLDSMIRLETMYPDTIFVYFTIPYFTEDRHSNSNSISNVFNNELRSWIAEQDNKVLFDIADLEAWSPEDIHQTFTQNGVTYETLYNGFTNDGVHLDATASQRVAIGLYSLFGKITFK